MNSNARILGAVVVGVSTWLLTSYVQSIMKQKKKHTTKKLAKEAVQSWEGEGGAVIDTVRRSTAG